MSEEMKMFGKHKTNKLCNYIFSMLKEQKEKKEAFYFYIVVYLGWSTIVFCVFSSYFFWGYFH